MSQPKNILDGYRSYSYQHILLMSNNSADMAGFHSGEFPLEKLNSMNSGDIIDARNGPIIMVCNSAYENRFSIDDLNFTTLYGSYGAGSGITSECTMTITEPKGI